jgi:hypothetical protein
MNLQTQIHDSCENICWRNLTVGLVVPSLDFQRGIRSHHEASFGRIVFRYQSFMRFPPFFLANIQFDLFFMLFLILEGQ